MNMALRRKLLFILSWILLSGNLCCCEEENHKEQPSRDENFPRLFRIFSRPSDKSTEKQEGSSIVDHLGNVFRGGSIGFEARPLAPLHGLIDKAKEFIPNPAIPDLASSAVDKAKELFPIPFIPSSPSKPKDTDRKDTEVKPKPQNQWESEDVVPVDPGNSKYPDGQGPKFEGVDEDYGEDYTTERIENIIQPRIRQKRSPESKVFHVPVQFLSNAKPFEVKIK